MLGGLRDMAAAGLDRTCGVSRPSDRQHGAADPTKCSSERRRAWCRQLPELASAVVKLRELRLTDAPSLSESLVCPRVGQHLSCGPASVAEIEEFIDWTCRARTEGRFICFGIIPPGTDTAVGVFQLWPLEQSVGTAEWGFALGYRFWGSGLFLGGAKLVMAFIFDTLDVWRLEARAAVDNGRGNAALKKLGAVPEGVLRKCFLIDGAYRDHMMWSILAAEWRAENDKNHDAAPRAAGEVT